MPLGYTVQKAVAHLAAQNPVTDNKAELAKGSWERLLSDFVLAEPLFDIQLGGAATGIYYQLVADAVQSSHLTRQALEREVWLLEKLVPWASSEASSTGGAPYSQSPRCTQT